jgi:hypothetical protein
LFSLETIDDLRYIVKPFDHIWVSAVWFAPLMILIAFFLGGLRLQAHWSLTVFVALCLNAADENGYCKYLTENKA